MSDSHPSAPLSDANSRMLLRNQLCHSLYSASNAMVRAYRPLLEPLGLTYPQYLVMLALWEHDAVPIKQLVEDTRLDAGTLTPILKRLEQKELVQRHKSIDDERQWLIALTGPGEQMREQASDIPLKLFCMTSMTLEQAQQLKQAAEQIYHDVVRRSADAAEGNDS
ncbi:MarR family transcriptional regulator [uncultured Halopseudomonas sp.]|uniref:MarR family winged helix-turn-helix transcriptional regulator n=1 Tax=uncultured Halopseudomonas sp. TaxID=2901193 RepID=UPI0030EBAA09